ncbi:hypothetical protein L873DRAFT_789870 [Choiromyces venosus 120613-1]|uniref:Uncharacterized protein n=1 Tax=Choiromyces venosus 120613-1 TaxID=1336337 RepID=A0A3N4K804_9PEZI|nr:hypothetical protein L873DRAFT_789870 [Choiromyces venosus 120613-1]
MNFTAIIAKKFSNFSIYLEYVISFLKNFYIATMLDGGHLRLVRSVAMYLLHTKSPVLAGIFGLQHKNLCTTL